MMEEAAKGLKPTDDGAVNLPTSQIAKQFSVETMDYPYPVGVHQVYRWLPKEKHVVSLDEWCPEYKMCSDQYIVDTPDQ
jgi:ABC-type nitrate/sulfonate/bicarbonate transport system substrate-binding protein